MSKYLEVLKGLEGRRARWLVTGGAGFIGSNLAEKLLSYGQEVIVLDNFSTGRRSNLEEIRNSVSESSFRRLSVIEGDIRNIVDCRRACDGVDYVLHQAALGSVPRSIDDPILTNANNIDGFLNMLVAARDAAVRNFVFAASSSTYGDHAELPKIEGRIGRPLSPYAVTKYVNELYADVFSRNYGFKSIGLRYFNVFGPRQDPNGAYAAVIPRWAAAMIRGDVVRINGDGSTSRDFCYIDNAVQANILAALHDDDEVGCSIFNVAVGEATSLLDLYKLLYENLSPYVKGLREDMLAFGEFRVGDVRHSLADISKARFVLGYTPTHRVSEGIAEVAKWYLTMLKK